MTEADIEIRPFLASEMPMAFALGREFYEEHDVAGVFDVEKAVQVWEAISRTRRTGTVSAWDRGSLMGGAGFFAAEDEFSDHRYVAEAFLFLLPAYRGCGLMGKFVTAMESWGKEHQLPEVCLGRFTTAMKGLGLYYSSLGYEHFRSVYRKRL